VLVGQHIVTVIVRGPKTFATLPGIISLEPAFPSVSCRSSLPSPLAARGQMPGD